MSEHGPLLNVTPFVRGFFMGTCPKCGLRARMDADMVAGRVSVDCPECEYHETHKHDLAGQPLGKED